MHLNILECFAWTFSFSGFVDGLKRESPDFFISLSLHLCLLQWFRSAVVKENAMPEGLMTLFFSNIDPIYEFHRSFLKELEQRLALW